MIQFYMTPGSCSTGIHILLEELELVFGVHLVNLLAGDHLKPEYLAINPKASIPTLVRDDGVALTDFQSIAWWLAKTHPKRALLPDTLDGELLVLERMNYALNVLHGQGFARIFTTEKFSANPADTAAVQAQGREIIERGFGLVEQWLEGQSYLVGERYTIADAAFFYVAFWADRTQVALPNNCRAHFQRLLQRPAVRQVLAEEGYGAMLREAETR